MLINSEIKLLYSSKLDERLADIKFLPDGETLVSAGVSSGKVMFWQAQPLQKLYEFDSGLISARCLDVNTEGNILAVGGQALESGCPAYIWDLKDHTVVSGLPFPPSLLYDGVPHPEASILALAITRDNKRVVSGLAGVHVYSLQEGILQEEFLEGGDWYSSVAIHPGEEYFVATACWSGLSDIEFYQFGEVTAFIEGWEIRAPSHWGSASFSSDGKYLAASGYPLCLYSFPERQRIDLENGDIYEGTASAIFSHVFSPDSKKIFAGAKDGAIIVWDVATGAKMNYSNSHAAPIFSIAINPTGNSLATFCTDNLLKIWQIAS